MNGVLTRDYTREKLKETLEKEIFSVALDNSERKKKLSSIIGRRNKK
jgi:diadenylate cyclase